MCTSLLIQTSFVPSIETEEGVRIRHEAYRLLLEEQSMMVYFGHLTWEAVESMTPFERKIFNKTIEKKLSEAQSEKPKPSQSKSHSALDFMK